MELFISILLFVFVPLITFQIIYWIIERKRLTKLVKKLENNSLEFSPTEFFKLRNKTIGRNANPDYIKEFNVSGIYILHNVTKDMYYVGQGKMVLERVNSHFVGRGNGDVYADYKYGDTWIIQISPLRTSDFNNLNDLERNAIQAYNSFHKGYNRTRGNKNIF